MSNSTQQTTETGQDDGIERISGYVGRVITHDEVDQYYFGEGAPVGTARPRIDRDEAIVTVGGKTPPRLDRWLKTLTAGVLGYSIEPADITWVVVDRDEAAALQPGDRVQYPATETRSEIEMIPNRQDTHEH